MPIIRTPRGITPPTPGLEREEPTFVPEEDIPVEQRGNACNAERGNAREERPARASERE